MKLSKLLFCFFIMILGSLFFWSVQHAAAQTSVSVTTNTGNNTINGATTTGSSRTRIEVNGKVYVNEEGEGEHNISEETENGRVEIRVNNKSSSNQNSMSAEIDAIIITPQPSLAKEEIEKKKEEVRSAVEKKKQTLENQHISFISQLQHQMKTLFESFTSLFSK